MKTESDQRKHWMDRSDRVQILRQNINRGSFRMIVERSEMTGHLPIPAKSLRQNRSVEFSRNARGL